MHLTTIVALSKQVDSIQRLWLGSKQKFAYTDLAIYYRGISKCLIYK